MRELELGSVTPGELAGWVCSTPHGPQEKALVAEAVLSTLSAPEFLDFIDETQAMCDEIAQGMLWHAIITSSEATNPAWVSAVRLHLTPERVFSSRSAALVQLAQTFIRDGDEYLLAVLQEGGRGFLGGTPDQMDRAATIVCVTLPEGDPYVSYLESLIESPETTDGIGMGCTLAAFLASPKALVDGRPDRALEALNRVLDDERFRFQAAAQLLSDHAQRPVPDGFDGTRWSELMDRASIIRSQGK